MNSLLAGITIAIFGGALNGSFAIFMKYKDPWRWENFWFVYSIVALILFPIAWLAFVIPSLGGFFVALSVHTVFLPMVFGALWGVGSVLFGLAVERIGMGLTFTVVVGLSTIIGTLTPLFLHGAFPSPRVLISLIGALLVILAGITVGGYAGFRREKLLGLAVSAGPRHYVSGLIMAIISGIVSPMVNVGFAYGKEIGHVAERLGTDPHWAPLATLAVVLFGGFLVNIAYAGFLLWKNKSYTLFWSSGPKPLAGGIASGIFWFGGIGLYAIATAFLGILGTSAGYAVNTASAIIAGNSLGIFAGEWKAAKRPLILQLISVFALIVGILIISITLL